jgi:5-methylcytosine-specific restriction endonuclease McrA
MNKTLQLRVFRRDKWLCYLCGRPVIFAPAMRLLEESLRRRGHEGPLAYFDVRWGRDKAPLLDHLAAVIEHKTPRARGGKDDEANLKTACN